MSLIQHLNVIVDPQAPALADYDPPGGVTGGGDPVDATPDPTEAGRNPQGRLVRTGGSGIQAAKSHKGTAGRAVVINDNGLGGYANFAAGVDAWFAATAAYRDPKKIKVYCHVGASPSDPSAFLLDRNYAYPVSATYPVHTVASVVNAAYDPVRTYPYRPTSTGRTVLVLQLVGKAAGNVASGSFIDNTDTTWVTGGFALETNLTAYYRAQMAAFKADCRRYEAVFFACNFSWTSVNYNPRLLDLRAALAAGDGGLAGSTLVNVTTEASPVVTNMAALEAEWTTLMTDFFG